LVEKAREGKTVVRLKWGDPFVFDSGGKEALFLHEQQIPFEVVPGVPATVGVPAYAGIPITYPGAGDVVTLVCFAGAQQVGAIAAALLANGRSPEETAALIYHGTTAGQQTVMAPLGSV